MKGAEHTLNLSGSVREYSQRKNMDIIGKTEPLVSKGSKNLRNVSLGTSQVSKGILKEGGRLKAVRTTAAVASPLATGTIVGAVAVGVYGIANMLRYRRNEKSGVRAAKDTITGSAGVGISTALGVATANVAVGTFGSVVLVPVAAGAAVAYVSMAVWDKLFYTGKCPSKIS